MENLSTAHDQATLDFYTAEASLYVEAGKGRVSRWLGDFMQALPPGACILELGCGGGGDAEAMLAMGFDVHPTDGTPAMAVRAAERLGCPVRVMRFDELAESHAYDGIWANASLLHVPQSALGDVLARIFAALKPGGLHFANYKSGGIAGRDSLGRYFNYPDKGMLIDAYVRSASWEILASEEYVGGSYDGGKVPWIAITARRPPL